jgi:hypothetical protein
MTQLPLDITLRTPQPFALVEAPTLHLEPLESTVLHVRHNPVSILPAS